MLSGSRARQQVGGELVLGGLATRHWELEEEEEKEDEGANCNIFEIHPGQTSCTGLATATLWQLLWESAPFDSRQTFCCIKIWDSQQLLNCLKTLTTTANCSQPGSTGQFLKHVMLDHDVVFGLAVAKVRALNMTTRYDYSSIADQGYLTGPPNMVVEARPTIMSLLSATEGCVASPTMFFDC